MHPTRTKLDFLETRSAASAALGTCQYSNGVLSSSHAEPPKRSGGVVCLFQLSLQLIMKPAKMERVSYARCFGTAIFGMWLSTVTSFAQTAPVIVQQPANQFVVTGGAINLSVLVSGPGPFQYQWRFNGTNLPNDIITTVAGNGADGYSGDGGPATNAKVGEPFDVATDRSGQLFIFDDSFRIRKVTLGGVISTVAGGGTDFPPANGIAATNAALYGAAAFAVDASDRLFVASGFVWEIGADGLLTNIVGNFSIPIAAAVDRFDNLFLAETNTGPVVKVSPNGTKVPVAGTGAIGFSGDGGPATNATLNWPVSLAVDSLGNLYIADEFNFRVRKVGTNGIITTVAGNGARGSAGDGGLATNASLQPVAVAVDANGNLFVGDGPARIRMVSTNGTITTVVGNGSTGYSGDGGPATNASLSTIGLSKFGTGISVDPFGNLFIADSANSRVRKVALQGPNLLLDSVSPSNAGSYDVVISNNFGAVTSSIASVDIAYLAPAGRRVFITNTVPSTNEPVQFILDASAPEGTRISSNGVFSWIPACAQGGTTNAIIAWAIYSTVPPTSNALNFTVVVPDCVQVSLGTATVIQGQSAVVPLTVQSTTSLTNLSLVIGSPAGYLTNWYFVLSSNAGISSFTISNTNSQPQFNFVAFGGLASHKSTMLGYPGFGVLAGGSAFVPLALTNIVPTKSDGDIVTSIVALPGRAVVIGIQPLLDVAVDSNRVPMLTIYTRGLTYEISSTTNLASPVSWTVFTNVTPTISQTVATPITTSQAQFFRAQQQ